jgi:hypothetical protein
VIRIGGTEEVEVNRLCGFEDFGVWSLDLGVR